MPVIGPELGELIKTNMRNYFQAITKVDPMSQQNPSYFMQFAKGLGMGFMEGTPSISFVTADLGVIASPVPIPGVGHGVGINTNAQYMSQKMYTNIRDRVMSAYGISTHEPWPPTKGNSGEVLKALTDAISDAVHEHYSKSLILVSFHPLLVSGTGKVMKGSFSGLVPQTVSAAIIKNTGSLQGAFWPAMTLAIAEAYVDGIHKETTATVDIGPGGGGGVPGVGTGTAT
jgi:hypothetical protein